MPKEQNEVKRDYELIEHCVLAILENAAVMITQFSELNSMEQSFVRATCEMLDEVTLDLPGSNNLSMTYIGMAILKIQAASLAEMLANRRKQNGRL